MYLGIWSGNISSFTIEVNNMPIYIIIQEIFNNSNTRFNFDLLRRCISSSITFTNDSWSFSMILYPNRKRWFLNITSRNNRIIISDSLFFNCNRCNYFYFNGRIIFKSLLLREINVSSKGFTERSYYLGVKSIFSAKSTKSIDIHKRFNTTNLGVIPDSLPSSEPQSSELRLILSNKSYLNSVVFSI